MATSSIFAEFKLNDPQKIEEFTTAYIKAAEIDSNSDKKTEIKDKKILLTDLDAIKKLMTNGDTE